MPTARSEKFSSLNLNARFLKPNEINEKPHGKGALAIRGGFGCVSGVARAGEVRPAAVHTTQPQPQPSEARDVRLDTPISTMVAAAVVAARSLSFRHLHPHPPHRSTCLAGAPQAPNAVASATAQPARTPPPCPYARAARAEHLRAVAAPVERARRARRPRRRHFRRSTGRIRLLGRAPPLEPRDLARAARAPERAARSRAAQAARRDAAASSCASSAPSAPNSSPSLTMPSPLRPPARLLCPVDGAPSAAATHASRRRALRVLTPRGTPPDRRSGRDTRRFVPRRCPTGRTRAIKNTRHCSAASAAAALSLAHAAPSLSAGATRVHMTHNSAGTRGSRNTTGLTPPPPKSRGMAVGGRGRAHIVPIIRDRPHHETHPNEQGEHASERRRPDPDSPKRVAPNGATRPTPTDNTSER